LAAARPAVIAGAGHPEGAAGVADAGLAGPGQDLDTPVVDDLCWVTVVDSCGSLVGTKGSTTSPTAVGPATSSRNQQGLGRGHAPVA
jgi:hypothetical protein